MNKKNVKFKYLLFSTIILIFILSILSSFNIFITIDKYSESMLPNIYIQNIYVGELTKEEAYQKIKYAFDNQINNQKLIFKDSDKEFMLSYSSLNISYNIEKGISEAYSIGRNENIIKKYELIKYPTYTNIPLEVTYDHSKVESFADQVAKDVKILPVDAKIRRENGKFVITDETIGQYIDVNTLIKVIESNLLLNNPSMSIISLDIQEDPPNIKSNDLKRINTKISSFSTNYNANNYGRSKNIEIAANAINGIVVFPGEEFSFNKIVGSRTRAKGYMDAKIILNNKLIPGLAGGICQVSTTLYSAILECDILPTEREHHTLPSTYVPMGFDATVTDNAIDFKFKNTLKYPIYIQSYCEENYLTVNIYSDLSISNVTHKLESKVTKVVENSTKYINDPLLHKGITEVEVPGTKGYHVDVYLISYENGKQISRKLIYKDFYEPINRIIRVGVAK